MFKVLVLVCASFSAPLAQCTDEPNMSYSDNATLSYQIFLNGKKTTWNAAAGWRAHANISNNLTQNLKPGVPVTTNNVRTTMSLQNEDCNTVLVRWELVNTAAEERIVGVCVYADAFIIIDTDVWTLFPNHTGLYVNAPFYIRSPEPFSGISPGANCNSNAFNLNSSDMMSFNWNNITLAASETRVFEVRYANYESENCTLSDIKISYGPCINNTRDIVFYVTNCMIAGDFHVPAPLRRKPCNFSCPSGQYYDLTTDDTNCTSCTAGREADGFSVVYNNLTADDMSPFTSTCNGTDCKNWTVWGNYLTTGFQNSYVHVNLSLSVNIFQTTGEILFEYTCPETRYNSAELFFYIDGHRMNNNSYISDIWMGDHYPLSFGTHQLTWEFQSWYYYDPSEIGARLRNVEIRGTKYLVTSCRGCPSGRTSIAGGQCTPCQFNTVPGNGTGTCVTCPTSQYAYPGDFECHDRVACVDTDYYEEYGPCINNQRTITKKLYTPVICLEGTAPPQTSGTCPICDPGHYNKSGVCSPCEDGTYRNSTMTDDKCIMCPGGTYATKNDNNMRPTFTSNSWYKTGCVSDERDIDNCATKGWLEEEKVITSGNHFGPVTVYLNRTVNSTEFGTLFFSYTTKLRNDSYFKFYSSGYSYLMVNSTENNVRHNFTAYFYSGSTNFSWLFIKTCHNGCPKNDYSINDTVEIDELSISTESVGGGTECTGCHGGYFAPEGSVKCQECVPGTFSEDNSSECSPCPDGSYSNSNYATACKPCLNNTYPSDDRSTCVFNSCGFQHNETYAFSLAALQTDEAMLNATRPNNETRVFYLDICTQAHSNSTCKDYYIADKEGGYNAYACTLDATSQYIYTSVLGREAEMNFLEQKDANDLVLRYGVNLTYTNGDSQPCGNTWVPQSIEILFICVPDSGVGEPLPATEFQDTTENCRYHYEWVTEYACRICSGNDYDKLEGACVKGKKNTTYVMRQTQTQCTHGYAPNPVWQISSCPNPLVKLSAGAVAGIVIGALVLLAIAIFFIVFYIRKNRALRYQLFQKSNFSLVDRTEEDAGAGDAPSSTSMFGGDNQQQEEQYKSVDFSGMAQTADSAY